MLVRIEQTRGIGAIPGWRARAWRVSGALLTDAGDLIADVAVLVALPTLQRRRHDPHRSLEASGAGTVRPLRVALFPHDPRRGL